jgi:hypothetical protein
MVGCGVNNEPAGDIGPDASGDVGIDVAVDAPVADGETTESDAGQDLTATDLPVDSIEDGDVSADAPVGPLDVPFVTPPCLNPYVDNPFVQEINHTGIEIDPEITDVYDVVIRPDWAPAWFDNPTQVNFSGFNRHADGVVESYFPQEILGVPMGAAFGPAGLYVIYRQAIVLFTDSGYTLEVTFEGEDGVVQVVRAGGKTVVTTTTGLLIVDESGLVNVSLADNIGVIAATLNGDASRLYVARQGDATSIEVNALSLDGSARFLQASPSPVGRVRQMVADVKLPQALGLVIIGDEGIAGIADMDDPVVAEVPEFAEGRLPLAASSSTDAVLASDGGFIVTAEGGAFRMMLRDTDPEWRFYNAFRWVAGESVRRVATTPEVADSPVYFASDGGMTWVTVTRMTLEQKVDTFVDRVVTRHDRDGAVADSHLTVAGDLSTNIPWDSDNDGGWTCYWVIGECMRYKMTGDPEAKAHFDKSLQAMLNLRTLTGTDWFLARAVIRIDGCILDDCDAPDDGEWFKSPDGEWWIKSDTSNDEVTSHTFMMAYAYDMCADETQKQAIRDHMSNIVGGIIDHGYQIWKPNGECTTYGAYDPFYVNSIGMLGDGGQLSTQILASITLAYYMTGDQKFLDAKNYLINEHHYDENVVHESEPPGRQGTGDGDELSTQGFIVLMRYETDPALYAKWLDGWQRTYSHQRQQQAALWDVINGVVGGETPEYFYTARWLKLTPMDLIRWNLHNSHRQDLVPAPEYYMKRCADCTARSDGYIIPPDERRNDRFNTNQYMTDGGWGSNIEMDGAEVIASYWMARYYGFIVPATQDAPEL